MPDSPVSRAASFGIAATFVLGVVLPLMMVPASKSSPLFLGIAAALAATDAFYAGAPGRLGATAARVLRTPESWTALALIAIMLISCLWAHDRAVSLKQFVQFIIPVLCGVILALAFPGVAHKKRALWWCIAAGLASVIVITDLKTGFQLRQLTGGRATDYSYNRSIVTLTLLVWPLLALVAVRRQWRLLALLVPIPLAVYTGESQTAVLGLLVGVIVFPVARFLPRLTNWLGLVTVLTVLAVSPFFGTLAKQALGASFHKAMEAGHSDDRVQIWLSFEAAAQKKWLLGNGFGSSLNLQNAAVAKEIAPERVTLLGASHPHNAFLQLWVELGLTGAALAALLFIFLFRAIRRADPRLQPFMLTWVAVVCAIALVSHGAWQAWWVAAIAASSAGFLAIAHELRAEIGPAAPL
jgi:exopolysaccharide production protein ExoQ